MSLFGGGDLLRSGRICSIVTVMSDFFTDAFKGEEKIAINFAKVWIFIKGKSPTIFGLCCKGVF